MTDIKQYEPLWGSWYVDSLLGEGSYGKVYKVHKDEFGKRYEAAVKIMSIPQNEAELRQAQSDGMDAASAKSYFHAFVTDIIQEIDLMSAFRGNSNIVSLEDHKVIEHADDIGWDILIRMELLSTLSSRVTDRPLSADDVIKLGIDICRALELCAAKKTIHRDIKPDNIFVSPFGDFKLGDFGIARQIERTMSGLSKKGTYTYMAPEVFKGEEYGASVDVYSLGIVMYRFLNKNRTPFLPTFPEPITPHDRDEALQRRMKGEPITPITDIDPKLNEIVLKACAYDRADRFSSAEEMRYALEEIACVAHSPAPTVMQTRASAPRDFADDKTQVIAHVPTHPDPDEDAQTVGIFAPRQSGAHQKIPEMPIQDATEVPINILRGLGIVGGICFAALAVLSFFSGRASDPMIFMPVYLICAAQCAMRFGNKVMNLLTALTFAAHLGYIAIRDIGMLDCSTLILAVDLCVIASASVNERKAQIGSCVVLSLAAVASAAAIGLLSGSSYSLAARVSAVPIIFAVGAIAAFAMLKDRAIGAAIGSSLQLFIFVSFAAYAVSSSPVFFYIADASFIGFSPERFAWWQAARFGGLIIQLIASASLVALEIIRTHPGMTRSEALTRRSLLAFAGSVVIMAACLAAIPLLPLFSS